jgi:hypothetical protein
MLTMPSETSRIMWVSCRSVPTSTKRSGSSAARAVSAIASKALSVIASTTTRAICASCRRADSSTVISGRVPRYAAMP